MLLVCFIVFFHIDVAVAVCYRLSLCLFLGLLLFVFPHLCYTLRELSVDRHLHICQFLDENDTIVEMSIRESHAKGRIPVDVLRLQLGASLHDVE